MAYVNWYEEYEEIYIDGKKYIKTTFLDADRKFIREEITEAPEEPIPEPTEQELVQAELLLNQIEIMQKQDEQDEVLAEILLNQLGV